jgi:hypothetical protein
MLSYYGDTSWNICTISMHDALKLPCTNMVDSIHGYFWWSVPSCLSCANVCMGREHFILHPYLATQNHWCGRISSIRTGYGGTYLRLPLFGCLYNTHINTCDLWLKGMQISLADNANDDLPQMSFPWSRHVNEDWIMMSKQVVFLELSH